MRKLSKNTLTSTALLTAGALLLAACSSDSTTTPTVKPSVTTAATTSAESGEAGDSYDDSYDMEENADAMLLAGTIDENPLTGQEVDADEAECIAAAVTAENPELAARILEDELMSEENMDDEDVDLDAEEIMTVFRAAAECGRDSMIEEATMMMPEVSEEQAECMVDSLFGEDSIYMEVLATMAELEAQGIDEESDAYMEAAMGAVIGLLTAQEEIAAECEVSEEIVGSFLELDGGDDDWETEDSYEIDYGDDGDWEWEWETEDSYDSTLDDSEEISAEQALCFFNELADYPELIEAFMNDDNYEPSTAEEMVAVLEATVACDLTGSL